MTTSDTQVIARALYDALVGSTLQSLRVAAARLQVAQGDGADLDMRIAAALPEDTPREVRNFVVALARERALDRLPGVVQAFESFAMRGMVQRLSGEVISAIELNEAQRAHIQNDLRSRYGEVELRFSVDPTLIGGLIIRVGDQVLDNSLRTRLSAVQRNMIVG